MLGTEVVADSTCLCYNPCVVRSSPVFCNWNISKAAPLFPHLAALVSFTIIPDSVVFNKAVPRPCLAANLRDEWKTCFFSWFKTFAFSPAARGGCGFLEDANIPVSDRFAGKCYILWEAARGNIYLAAICLPGTLGFLSVTAFDCVLKQSSRSNLVLSLFCCLLYHVKPSLQPKWVSLRGYLNFSSGITTPRRRGDILPARWPFQPRAGFAE